MKTTCLLLSILGLYSQATGGTPLASFLVAGTRTGQVSEAPHHTVAQDARQPLGPVAPGGPLRGHGSPNRVAKFSALGTLMNSSIFDNGKVGIGTQAPAHALDVVGDLNVTGQLLVNGAPLPIPTPMVPAETLNPKKIALLRWYGATEAGAEFPVGPNPKDLAFDGEAMWVSNDGDSTVTKLRASDGANLGTFAVSGGATSLAYDGHCLWVANGSSGTVTKLRGRDGVVLGAYPAGKTNARIAFDGAHLWVADAGAGTVTKTRARDGALLGTYVIGNYPRDVVFDGANIWVTGGNGFVPHPNTLTKLRPSDGAVLGTIDCGHGYLYGIAFDGAHLWMTANDGCYCVNPNKLLKMRISDGTFLAVPEAGILAESLCFDGSSIWIGGGGSLRRFRASDGSLLGTYPGGGTGSPGWGGGLGIAFDGASIWVTNYSAGTVSKQ